MFFGFVTKHACDGRTDRQTDGQNYDPQDSASIAASRDKNVITFSLRNCQRNSVIDEHNVLNYTLLLSSLHNNLTVVSPGMFAIYRRQSTAVSQQCLVYLLDRLQLEKAQE